jgi:hypothetical protein
MAPTWWRDREVVRATARDLTHEFVALNVEGVEFHVRAHGRRSLELLVWPEGGHDNYVFPVGGCESIADTCEGLREIVARYAVGLRPPFG